MQKFQYYIKRLKQIISKDVKTNKQTK